MTTQWFVIISCDDCTGVDDQGCFDGGVERLGPFMTKEEADAASNQAWKDAKGAPWSFEVVSEVGT